VRLRQTEAHDEHDRPRVRRGLDEGGDLSHADVTPDEGVDTEHEEGCELDKQNKGELGQQAEVDIEAELEVETQLVGEDEGRDHDDDVDGELNRAVEEPLPPGRRLLDLLVLSHPVLNHNLHLPAWQGIKGCN